MAVADSDHKSAHDSPHKGGSKGKINILGHDVSKEEALLVILGIGGLLFAYLAWRSESAGAISSGSSGSQTTGGTVPAGTAPGEIISSGNSGLSNAINGLTSYLQSTSPSVTGMASKTPTTKTPTVMQYVFSANDGETTGAMTAPAQSGIGYTGSSNPNYAGLTNPAALAAAQSEGLHIYYQPQPGIFKSAQGVKFPTKKPTTLYAKT